MGNKHTDAEVTLPPVPTTIKRNTGASSFSEDEFLEKAPLEKVAEYLRKKYDGQEPF